MAKDNEGAALQQPPAPKKDNAAEEGQTFFYRVVKWPKRRGDKKPMKPNATALGRAWENGKEYSNLLITKGKVDERGSDVREESVPLTAKLCAKAKVKIEKQWSGPNFEQDMEVEFRPVPKAEPVAAEA